MRLLVTVFLSLGVSLASITISTATTGPEYVQTVEGISEYRLSNGLQVLLVPDQSRPTTTINITYKVGSKHESYGETGMAHLLEHMLFYGTPTHQDIKAEISERGGRANGTTWYERTNYFQVLPAGEENLEWALRMEADRMVNSLIREEDLVSEMTVVRNEYEIGETNPFRVLMQRVMSQAYLWHGYGRSTIGARSDIEGVPIERLHAFYRRYYQPDNAILILSGNIDPERTLALVEQYFGVIPKPERVGDMALWPTYTRDPIQDGERTVTTRRAGTVRSLMTAFHIPSAAHEDYAPLEVLSFILGDMPSGRLYEPLIGSELATQVGSFSLALPEPSLMMFYVQTRDGQDMEQIRDALLDTIEQAKVSTPTEDEVTRAINALITDIEQNLNDSGRVGVELSEWASMGDWRLMFLHRDRIESVTPEDVTRVLKTYLKRDNRTIGIFLPDSQPERAEIPKAPELASLLEGYEGREVDEVTEVFEPTAHNIETNRVSFTLSNGAKVTVLPRATRGQRVWGQITLRTGNLQSLSNLGSTPGMTSAMLTRGSQKYSRQAIRDEVDKLRSSMRIGGDQRITVSLESQRDRLDALLDIVEDVLKHPTFPEDELDELKRQSLTGIEQQRDEPSAVANQAISRHLNPYPPSHPDYTPSWDEQIERVQSIDRADLVAFHQSHYGAGPQTTISFVGDVDVEQLKTRLEATFGNWNSSVSYELIEPLFSETRGGRLTEQMPDKANAMMLGIQTIPMRTDHPDYPALKLAGEMLGGGFLNSRLADRIRDQEGLSYGVGGQVQASDLFESGTFFAYAMFAPQNRDRLIEVVFEELNKVLVDGFSQDEMEAVRSGYLKELELQRSSDRALTSLLNQNLFLDRDLYYWASFEQALQALSVEDVNRATRQHLDPETLLIVTAGDFNLEDTNP
jgi:zinc protease